MTTPGDRSAPLRVALTGAGMISHYHLIGWRKLESAVELVAICDPDAGRARARAQEFGVPRSCSDAESLFAEPFDVLDVASPRETHAF